jgi:hypothetical protein
MVRKQGQSEAMEIVSRKWPFPGTPLFFNKGRCVKLRKEGSCPMDFNPEDGSSMLLQNVDTDYNTIQS